MSTTNPPPATVPAAANGGSTAIATAPRPSTLRGWLNDPGMKADIARALPKHCNADRMTRIALTALTRTPKLQECDTASFMQCLLDLSQWGLEPNGRDAHLIPFNNKKRGVVECQLIIDYKGLVQLCYRTGQVESIHSDVVYANDDFYYSMGEVRRHVPWWIRDDLTPKPAEAGAVVAFYTRVKLKGGATKCEVMSKVDVDKVRSRSRAGGSGPWVTDYAEMGKKTVFRRASKWLPVSAEIVSAFERDFDRPVVQGELMGLPAEGPSSLDALADRLDGGSGDPPADAPSDEPTPEEAAALDAKAAAEGGSGELFPKGAPDASAE